LNESESEELDKEIRNSKMDIQSYNTDLYRVIQEESALLWDMIV